MQRIICLASFVSVMSAVAYGQSTEDAVAGALLAAPPAMQGEAMAIRLEADGDHEVLRDGTNGLVCWDRSDEPQRSFSVQCTSVENLPRVKQNRAWAMSGKSADEIRVIRDAAEADGSREVSKFGSTYYTLAGQDQASATLHITIAVPFATSDSVGLPSEGSYTRAGTWIMEAGTSAAHIMVPGQ